MELATTTLEWNPLVHAEIEAAAPLGDMNARRFVPAFYVNAGASITFKLSREPEVSCRWRLNGQPIDEGTGAVLALSNVGATGAGTYSVAVGESGQSAVLDVATLTVVSDARLTQFSIRSQTAVAAQNLVAGFCIGGAGAKRVLLRSVGPAQSQLDHPDGRGGPELQLAGWGGKLLASNRGGNNPKELAEVLPQIDGWSQPPTAADAALVATLETGGYSALVSGANEASGVILLELYDADPGVPSTSLSNVSGRAYVGGGSAALAIGFKIAGTASATVLVRGVGPSLQSLFGLSDALARTQVTLRGADGREVSSNSHWGGGALLAAAFAQAGAFALPPSSYDSALLVTLPPGAYTAELSGVEDATGVGLIEVYEVPAQ